VEVAAAVVTDLDGLAAAPFKWYVVLSVPCPLGEPSGDLVCTIGIVALAGCGLAVKTNVWPVSLAERLPS